MKAAENLGFQRECRGVAHIRELSVSRGNVRATGVREALPAGTTPAVVPRNAVGVRLRHARPPEAPETRPGAQDSPAVTPSMRQNADALTGLPEKMDGQPPLPVRHSARWRWTSYWPMVRSNPYKLYPTDHSINGNSA